MKECCFILFGATGDLSLRKIFPSLYQIYSNSSFDTKIKIIASSRTKLSQDDFKKELEQKAKIHIKNLKESKWQSFLKQIVYVSIELKDEKDFLILKEQSKNSKNIVVYFAISPEFFIQACKNLAFARLNDKRVKIVLEKPLGADLSSFKAIHNELEKYYKEEQIYRIDHYLGKEAVQNLLYLRTQNPLLKQIWNNKHISYVELTVFETLGVGSRGGFYDKFGASRDMLQNHMFQILSLITMNMPKSLSSSSIRREKCKLLKALRVFDTKALKDDLIRAQYTKNGEYKSYIDEDFVEHTSKTETFVALKLFIDNKTWQNIPFYLRTGKRMLKQFAQIVFGFKDDSLNENKLVISLQPDSLIDLNLNVKKQGKEESANLNLHLDLKYNERITQAYENLIMDAIKGDLSSFNHKEELEAAWIFLEPILEYWKKERKDLCYYLANTWGPKEADMLIQRDGHSWYNA